MTESPGLGDGLRVGRKERVRIMSLGCNLPAQKEQESHESAKF